jgi:glutamate-ammonia-ligase adenylyltransferase
MNFENIVSKYPMIDMLYKTFIDRPDFLHMVIRLSSYSHTFVSILCEAPTYLEYLMTHYQEWLFETGYDPALEYSHYKSLTHFKRMEFIRLALQLSDQKYSQNILFKNLSRLADYTLNQVFEKHFKANDDLVVFGLGKLGGQELSFKSDLDVIFVCADTAEVDDLIAKAKKFLNEISAVSEQGRIYEIDARLRPEGTRAPLVVTASRYADYLETRAAFWERQALVKARCVCGDRSLAEQVQRLFSAKIYGKGLSNDDAGSIIQMRQRQIKEKIKTPSDVLLDTKFSRGALLDIEYLIQAYQIKFGEKYPPLQTTNTIDAIDVFKKTEIFSSADADCLIENYIFLRNLEVYNFLAFERKSNKLSADEKQLAFLSKFLKFNKSTSIVDHLSTIKKQNEEIFSKLMRDLSHGK